MPCKKGKKRKIHKKWCGQYRYMQSLRRRIEQMSLSIKTNDIVNAMRHTII